MHALYTTYFANLKKVKFDKPTKIAIIMRMPPIAFLNFKDAIHVPELSPIKSILINYKSDGDFNKFTDKFLKQMENNDETKKFIKYVIDCIDDEDGNDICLVCCEKDRNVCHRSILADYISKITNCKVEEK